MKRLATYKKPKWMEAILASLFVISSLIVGCSGNGATATAVPDELPPGMRRAVRSHGLSGAP